MDELRSRGRGDGRRRPAGSVVLGTGPGGPQPLLSPHAPGLRQPLHHGQFRPLEGVVQSSVDAEGAVVPFLRACRVVPGLGRDGVPCPTPPREHLRHGEAALGPSGGELRDIP